MQMRMFVFSSLVALYVAVLFRMHVTGRLRRPEVDPAEMTARSLGEFLRRVRLATEQGLRRP
jgi:hypothetical protein